MDAFLFGFGPSFRNADKAQYRDLPATVACAGHWTFINGIRTDLFFAFDPPTGQSDCGVFPVGIYGNPDIAKHTDAVFRNLPSPEGPLLRDCPNMHFHAMNVAFDPATYLTSPTINWGDGPFTYEQLPEIIAGGVEVDHGVRASVLAALRILYDLGYRRLFLVGFDFDESDYRPHDYWKRLIERFERLKPVFDAAGYEIINCNRGSNLRCYPFMDFDEALASVGTDAPARMDAPLAFSGV